MPHDLKLFFGTASLILGLVSCIPYFISIFRKQTVPHVFSWLIWSLITAIAFAGQLYDGAGFGAWTTGLNTVTCFLVFVLAARQAEKNIARSDWICFLLALSAIPIWLITKQPLYSVLLVTCIDALGFYPTFRKSWHQPWQENLPTWFLAGLMYATSILAFDRYTLVTTLYPATLVITNTSFAVFALWRRQYVGKDLTEKMTAQ